MGRAYCGDALRLLQATPAGSVDLVMTSPPYALHIKKAYGNASPEEYVAWFLPFAREIKRVLKPDGSFVLNIGGSWTPKQPTRSLYHFRLLIALCDTLGYHLAQEFFWYNPAKMPAPAEWVTVRRVRVKDSVEYLFWLAPGPTPRADNTRVLTAYSKEMQRLRRRVLERTMRPSGHKIRESFKNDNGGAIPSNLLQGGNNEASTLYFRGCKALGMKPHPARFPALLPKFFTEFLTEPGELVLDPFAGSNTTGIEAEKLGRRWMAFEENQEYLEGSKLRFWPALAEEAIARSRGEAPGAKVTKTQVREKASVSGAPRGAEKAQPARASQGKLFGEG